MASDITLKTVTVLDDPVDIDDTAEMWLIDASGGDITLNLRQIGGSTGQAPEGRHYRFKRIDSIQNSTQVLIQVYTGDSMDGMPALTSVQPSGGDAIEMVATPGSTWQLTAYTNI